MRSSAALRLELPFRPPLCPDNLFGHLVATGIPGVEEWRNGAYRCAVRMPDGHAVVELAPRPDHVAARLWLNGSQDPDPVVRICRWLLDLDADPQTIDESLCADPVLAPLVAAAPGRRVPRTAEPEQFAIRAVLGQQVSTAAARTHAARLVRAHGDPIEDPAGGLTHLFPTARSLTGLDPTSLALPTARRETLLRLVATLASGELDLRDPADTSECRQKLYEIKGFGPWTVESIAMRALGDPDAFLPGDLGVRQAARRLGLPERPAELTARAHRWRPWRAYAVQHLWATGEHPVNRMPTESGH